MARKEKQQKGGDETPMWLVTFSDLTTLLLTFFVLLLSMASMDKSVISKVNIFVQDTGHVTAKGAGRIPTRISMIIDLIEDPTTLMDQKDRLKDLLFPDDIMPTEISKSTLKKNIEILKRPEGVALVMSDDLLFRPGSAQLSEHARILLNQIVEVLNYMVIETNISGYTDNTPLPEPGNMELSNQRALSVLYYFVEKGLDQSMFSVSGYGPYRPIAENITPEGRARNRRVEILLKTQPFLAGY